MRRPGYYDSNPLGFNHAAAEGRGKVIKWFAGKAGTRKSDLEHLTELEDDADRATAEAEAERLFGAGAVLVKDVEKSQGGTSAQEKSWDDAADAAAADYDEKNGEGSFAELPPERINDLVLKQYKSSSFGGQGFAGAGSSGDHISKGRYPKLGQYKGVKPTGQAQFGFGGVMHTAAKPEGWVNNDAGMLQQAVAIDRLRAEVYRAAGRVMTTKDDGKFNFPLI